MAEASVVDASPLILLSRAGYLPLLTALSPTVVLTPALERLMDCGMFISNLVLREALELAGE